MTEKLWRVGGYTSMNDATPTVTEHDDETTATAYARQWVADNATAPDPWAAVRHVTHRNRYTYVSRDHGERRGVYEGFQKYAVTDVSTIEEFLNRYYKRDRYTGRGEEYAACLLKSHTESLALDGYDIISRHDSNTGEVVAFYPKEG